MIPGLLPGPRSDLRATVDVPPSKSLTNRALVAAAAAGGGTVVSPLDCGDTRILAAALAEAGWRVEWHEDIEVGERTLPPGQVRLDLGDSGTGARLILGLLAASPGRCTIDGSPRLRERPLRQLLHPLQDLGAELREENGRLPVIVEGRSLAGGTVTVRPMVSSQFVSSLLMAAPLMRHGLTLQVEGPLPSTPYLDLTEDVLRAFGGEVTSSADRRRWQVAPVPLRPSRFPVEGDWSAAAFVVAAVAVAGGSVDLGPLDLRSRQGDRAVLGMLSRAGLDIEEKTDRLRVLGPARAPLVADLGDSPDLFPALVVVGAAGPPGSRFSGLDHLQHKESNRLAVMVDNLQRLGARVRVSGSSLSIDAPMRREPDIQRAVTAAGDHRIAMAMAVAALAAGPLELDDPSCVAKSFPGFWDMWDRLFEQRERGGA